MKQYKIIVYEYFFRSFFRYIEQLVRNVSKNVFTETFSLVTKTLIFFGWDMMTLNFKCQYVPTSNTYIWTKSKQIKTKLHYIEITCKARSPIHNPAFVYAAQPLLNIDSSVVELICQLCETATYLTMLILWKLPNQITDSQESVPYMTFQRNIPI